MNLTDKINYFYYINDPLSDSYHDPITYICNNIILGAERPNFLICISDKVNKTIENIVRFGKRVYHNRIINFIGVIVFGK